MNYDNTDFLAQYRKLAAAFFKSKTMRTTNLLSHDRAFDGKNHAEARNARKAKRAQAARR